jgi:hypothetical protein
MQMIDAESPPIPTMQEAAPWERSLRAYVLHGMSFIEHGTAMKQADQPHHMIKLYLGAPSGSIVELRILDPKFFSDRPFVAYVKRDKDVVQVGRAIAHPDKKGYQLCLAKDVEDGELLSLRPSAISTTSTDTKAPKHNPKRKQPRSAPRHG